MAFYIGGEGEKSEAAQFHAPMIFLHLTCTAHSQLIVNVKCAPSIFIVFIISQSFLYKPFYRYLRITVGLQSSFFNPNKQQDGIVYFVQIVHEHFVINLDLNSQIPNNIQIKERFEFHKLCRRWR